MRLPASVVVCAVLASYSAYADGIGDDIRPAYERCAACHGLDGISHMPKFPKLAGQDVDYILKQLDDFLHGRRANDGGQMATVVTEITAEQRQEAARYFAAQYPPVGSNKTEISPRGEELFVRPNIAANIPACAACHSLTPNSGAAPSQSIPRLWGQHRSYTAKQLHDFKSGLRANDVDGVMRTLAAQLDDADIDAISIFLENAGTR